MEPYKAYGRGQCGRGNAACGHNSRGYSQNSCVSNHNYNQQRSNSSCHSAIDNVISERTESCCNDNNHHMMHMPIAMAYVPMQKWEDLYDHETAICQGTAFPELNLIFCGSRGKM